MTSAELETIIGLLRAQPLVGSASIEDLRRNLEEAAATVTLKPDVAIERVEVAGLDVEWITIERSEARGVVLYLHGGGYCICSVNTHRDHASRIARASGARTLLIEYRLAPEHPFPAAVEDAQAAYRWLLGNGVLPAGIVMGGDSAGGGLTAATLVALRDSGDPLPAGAFCISPWMDLSLEGESMITKAEADPMVTRGLLEMMARAYAGSLDLRNPMISPLFSDPAGLPPMLLQVGTSEILLDDSTRFAERATAAGVDVTLEVWDDMFHVWHVFADMLPQAQQAIGRIGEWVRERMLSRERRPERLRSS